MALLLGMFVVLNILLATLTIPMITGYLHPKKTFNATRKNA